MKFVIFEKDLQSKISSLKNITSIIKMRYRLHARDVLFLSLGENCLTDNILNRHGVKSFSTPYSHARSNLDYALLLEGSCYDGFLDVQNFHYDSIDETKVIRSHSITPCDDIYDDRHMQGFEFTHHDIIASQKDRESIQRKISRLQTLKGKKNFVFFYHHRINPRSQLDVIFEKASKFREYYAVQGKTCQMVIFSQQIIHDASERKLEYKKIKPNIHYFVFSTHFSWS